MSLPKRSWKDLLADIFSFPVMGFVLLAAGIQLIAVHVIDEPDIWWHMRNGAYLLDHHAIPRVDQYSFTAAGSPWLNYEWLSEVPFAMAMRAMGLRGVLLVYTLVLWLIYGGLYYLASKKTDCKSALVLTVLAVALGKVSFGPRTLLFGWLCCVVLLIVLERWERTGRSLWLLPPLFALWINLHGSWVFGLVIFAIVIAAGLVGGEWGNVVARRWSQPELKQLLTVLGVSVAALFLNPYGYKLIGYPFAFLFHQQINMAAVDEWQPVMFSNPTGKLVLGLLALLIGLMLFSKQKWKLSEILLTAFALWVALTHVRFVFFLGIVVTPVLAAKIRLFSPYDRQADKRWLNALIIAGTVAGIFWLYPTNQTLDAAVARSYPEAAIKWMRDKAVNGRIFNLYLWGGYMEWNAPELKPFIDGRADIFVYNGVFDDYGHVATFVDPLQVLDKYKIDYVLYGAHDPLDYLLDRTPGWKLIYSDNVARLYERSEERTETTQTNTGPNHAN